MSTTRSSFISYKCCKTKPFLHFVCIKCFHVIHKSCIPKIKDKIRFVKDNKIVCCKTDDTSYMTSDEGEDDEKSFLEKTINDLSEDSRIKNRYIIKLKDDNKMLLEEALNTEKELNEQISNQEKIINELKKQITCLKKNIVTSEKKAKTVSTQTNTIKNNACTSTDITLEQMSLINKQLSVSAKINQKNNEHRNKISLGDEIVHRPQNNLNIPQTTLMGSKATQPQSYAKNSTHESSTHRSKKQILLLTDQLGSLTNKLLNKYTDLNSYSITSIVKPGAMLHQVIENIGPLTRHFTTQDFVIIIAGSNDIHIQKTPSFRFICNQLKQCSHTNILFASVPYSTNKSNIGCINKHIFKFNSKLNDFLFKFNKRSEGHISYVELNSKKFSKELMAHYLKNAVCGAKYQIKNLKFIEFINSTEPLMATSNQPMVDLTQSIVTEVVNISDMEPPQTHTHQVNSIDTSVIDIVDTDNEILPVDLNFRKKGLIQRTIV